MRKSLIILLSFSFATPYSSGQTTREEMAETIEKCGGVYYAYPVTESQNTPAPKGYKPFYISHYGRHGSRYLVEDDEYKLIVDLMHQAKEHDALTPLGKNVMARLDSVWEEARGRGGELAPLGARQHNDIAQRMYKAFPDVFAGTPEITAKSTILMRCAHSMFAFCDGLKELDPSLVIPLESSQRTMNYIGFQSDETEECRSDDGPWYQEWKKFKEALAQPDRLMKALFKDDMFVIRFVDPQELMCGLFNIARDMQNIETPISFMDLFTPDERFDLWQIFNFQTYARNSSYPYADGVFTDGAKNLLENILETADDYIANDKNGATLRFGHDSNIIPLIALLQLKNYTIYEKDPYKLYQVFSDYKISPMASNFQMIFFKNEPGDIIVKFMHNEREISIPIESDIYPFYKWSDARSYMQMILDTPSKDFIK